jgi:hypothetical protein
MTAQRGNGLGSPRGGSRHGVRDTHWSRPRPSVRFEGAGKDSASARRWEVRPAARRQAVGLSFEAPGDALAGSGGPTLGPHEATYQATLSILTVDGQLEGTLCSLVSRVDFGT